MSIITVLPIRQRPGPHLKLYQRAATSSRDFAKEWKFQPLIIVSNFNMAAVYKSLSKANGTAEASASGVKKNKQRVLILTSRGVTYRFVVALRQSNPT